MFLKLKIVTPERVLHEGEVERATLPTQMGQITILPHHIPLVSVLSHGEISAVSAHEEIFIAIEGGYVEIIPDGLVVLADAGQMAAEIDEAKVQEAIDRAAQALATTGAHDYNYEMLRALIERETSKIKVARKYKERGIHTRLDD